MRIDIAGLTRGGRWDDHEALLTLMQTIDALGFQGVWFNEFHFQDPPEPYPSTLLLAASIFARTQRLRVGTSILVLPLYHPLLLAEQITQLQWQSAGRFDLGIGRGTHPSTLHALGIDPAESRDLFETSYQTMMEFWATERAPGHAPPPIYVAGATSETLGFAARHGLPLLLSLEPPETRQVEIYRSVLSGRHRDCLPDSSLSRYVSIAPTTTEAMEALDRLLPLLQERRVRAATARGKAASEVAPIDREVFLAKQAIVGDPAACLDQLRALAAETGIRNIRLIFNGNGVLDDRSTIPAMTLFSQEVLPRLEEA